MPSTFGEEAVHFSFDRFITLVSCLPPALTASVLDFFIDINRLLLCEISGIFHKLLLVIVVLKTLHVCFNGYDSDKCINNLMKLKKKDDFLMRGEHPQQTV